MNHEMLVKITANMPCKTIEVDGRPSLSRYFAGKSETGGQWWYIHFHTAAGEQYLHSNPWYGRELILCGNYIEEFLQNDGRLKNRAYYKPGGYNTIVPAIPHRIAEVEPNTWTLLYIHPGRLSTWKFINDNGIEQIMKCSDEDWWSVGV